MRHEQLPAGLPDRDRLAHMHRAGSDAAKFIVGRTRADLDTDDLLRRGLINAIQEIGEAAARVTDAGRARVASLPWGQIVAMRHILVHVYWGIDLDQLWKAVVEDVPTLVTALEHALAAWPDEA